MRRVRNLAEPSRLRVGTWNIGSLMGKLREIVDTMIRRRVNILCVQEKKRKGQKAKEVEKYRFQTLIHRHYDKQEWSRHCAR
jgi:exonuclease III